MINYHVKDLMMAVKNDPALIENWLEDQRKTDYIMLHLDDFKKFKEPKSKGRSQSVPITAKLPKVPLSMRHIFSLEISDRAGEVLEQGQTFREL